MESIQEIAQTLRSTEKMAAAFVERVRERVGHPVPEEMVLRALRQLNQRTLDMAKVVTAVKLELGKQQGRAGRRRATRPVTVRPAKADSADDRALPGSGAPTLTKPGQPGTLMDQIDQVLVDNWTARSNRRVCTRKDGHPLVHPRSASVLRSPRCQPRPDSASVPATRQ